MLKATHSQESQKLSGRNTRLWWENCSMKLKEASKNIEDGIAETLTYCDFPSEH